MSGAYFDSDIADVDDAVDGSSVVICGSLTFAIGESAIVASNTSELETNPIAAVNVVTS